MSAEVVAVTDDPVSYGGPGDRNLIFGPKKTVLAVPPCHDTLYHKVVWMEKDRIIIS